MTLCGAARYCLVYKCPSFASAHQQRQHTPGHIAVCECSVFFLVRGYAVASSYDQMSEHIPYHTVLVAHVTSSMSKWPTDW